MRFPLRDTCSFADVRAAREWAMKINTVRRSAVHPDRAVRAGDIYAMGLIDEIFHYVVNLYFEQYGRSVLTQLERELERELGHDALERLLVTFSERFPTVSHYHGLETAQESLSRSAHGVSGRQVALEEMLVMWVGNRNPAFAPLVELFDEEIVSVDTDYVRFVRVAQDFFADRPTFGPEDQTLLALLRAPALAFPDDLDSQLDYIRTRWGKLVGSFLDRLLRSLDVIGEERKARFFGSPGEAPVLEFESGEDDYARFSPDRDWMPRAVIIAKSTLVWLDQLSKTYDRRITRLDQIPDEELDIPCLPGGLRVSGSSACGNAPARPSASNICAGIPTPRQAPTHCTITRSPPNWGGGRAWTNLRRRLWQRGIRIASDMVPNHTGIDGKWVYEHPDWFVGLPHSPFPGYSFHGENLSDTPQVGIYLEDHYYDRTDAAVVFKRVNHDTGDTRYVYHGNDGTSMPWNDTAQLDYLNPEVREAVIQTILHVARNFPIIRFDAAMTLAKKHIQRLWYPAPGTRRRHSLSQ